MNTGIRTMRSSVRRLGSFIVCKCRIPVTSCLAFGVKRGINFLRQRSAYTRDFCDFFNTGPFHFLNATEMVKQFPAPLGSDTRYALKGGYASRFATARPVPGNGEAV